MSSSNCPGPEALPWASAQNRVWPSVPTGHPRSDRPLAVSEPLELIAVPTAVRMARWHASDVLKRWGLIEELEWPALQTLSELFSNCANHAERTQNTALAVCSVTLRLFGDALCVEVRDPWPESPVLRNPSLDDESGRGLRIVTALCTQIKILATEPGKTVVAVLPRGL